MSTPRTLTPRAPPATHRVLLSLHDKIQLGAGEDGKAKVRVQAKKGQFNLDDFPAASPITIQLVRGNDTIEQCWQNTFDQVFDVSLVTPQTP